jgi:hypothetical protein
VSMSRATRRLAPIIGAVAVAGFAMAGPAAAATPDQPAAPTPVPVGSPGDANHNGWLDSSEPADNPDQPVGNPTVVPVGSPGDANGNGILDSSEPADNPDQP